MKKQLKIPLFLQVIMGIVLGQLILMGLVTFINRSRNVPSLSKNPVAEAEINQTLGGVVNGLKGYHFENGKFPQTYNAILGAYPHSLDYHTVEISPIDDNTVVFQISPKISDLYAFSGMVVYNPTARGYQDIICQSEQPRQAISFPEVISQCPSNTLIFQK